MRSADSGVDLRVPAMTKTATSRPQGADWIALSLLLALLAYFLQRHPVAPSWIEVLVTVAFAVGGWRLRGVDLSGAVAGGIVAFILYSAGGWRMFLVLLGVFVLTLLATVAGSGRKRALGLAEPSGGRSAAQVGANLIVAAGAMVLLPPTLAAVVAVAALAEAAADTVSSELGEAFARQTYLVTTLRPTVPGTNGGVSWVGTLAGTAAAASVAAVGYLVIGLEDGILAAAAGVFGMLVDSVLGATLENRGLLHNDAVNLFGTASAAGLAYGLCRL